MSRSPFQTNSHVYMLTEHEKEIFVLIITQITEKGVKECIDDINASPQNSMIDCLEAHQKLHSYLHYARQIIPDWNIKTELRESQLAIKLLVDTLRDCIEKLDTSNPELMEVKSYNQMHQALAKIREKDPTWSINGSIRYGNLNSQLRHPRT
jgi:hypothetical protein